MKNVKNMIENNSKAPAGHDDGPVWVEEWVPLASIQRVADFQVRNKLHAPALKRYRQQMDAGSLPPPIKAARLPSGALVLVDGWHRMECGALQVDHLADGGSTVLAMVAEMTEEVARWEAATSNLGHGVPVKARELRKVFAAFVKAGKHRRRSGKYLSYRDIGTALGVGHTTIHNWMKHGFPSVFRAIGGVEHGNPNGEPARYDIPTVEQLQAQEAIRKAGEVEGALGFMTPEERHEVVVCFRRAMAAAERLGTVAPDF